MNLFAQAASPAPGNLEPMLAWGVLILIVWLFDVVMRAVSFFRGSKTQNRNVTIAPGLVLEKDCVSRHDAVTREIRRIDGTLTEMREERREDVTGLYKKINHVAEDVAAVKTESRITGQQIGTIESDIKQLLSRVAHR